MANNMVFEMMETLARSNQNYESVFTIERSKNKLISFKVINKNENNQLTVCELTKILIFNALKPENLSQGIGFGIGANHNGKKCTLTRSKENEYVFSFS